MCLDEIGETSEKDAGETVYALANGCGRGRMTRNLTSRAAVQFNLIFLSTGERSLQEVLQSAGRQVKGGQEARLLEIPADAGLGMGLFEAIHEFASPAAMAEDLSRAAKSHYGTGIIPYVEHLVEHREAVIERVRRHRDSFVKCHAFQKDSGEVHRAASMVGLIAAAGEIATKSARPRRY